MAGCPSKDNADTAPLAETTSSSGDATSTGAATAQPGTDSTDPTGSDTSSSGNDSDTGDTTAPGDTGDTGNTTDTSGGDETPAECSEKDPAVAAAFEVTLDGWPGNTTEFHDIAGVMCVVDAVTVEAGTVVTALTCDVDGAPLPAGLALAAAPEGEVAWTVGDSVHLRSLRETTEFGGKFRKLSLHTAAGDSLLAGGVDYWSEFAALEPVWFAPLLSKLVYFCGPAPEFDQAPRPLQIVFEGPDNASVAIVSGHRGVLPIDAEQRYAIDVADATDHGMIGETSYSFIVLVRRVRL